MSGSPRRGSPRQVRAPRGSGNSTTLVAVSPHSPSAVFSRALAHSQAQTGAAHGAAHEHQQHDDCDSTDVDSAPRTPRRTRGFSAISPSRVPQLSGVVGNWCLNETRAFKHFAKDAGTNFAASPLPRARAGPAGTASTAGTVGTAGAGNVGNAAVPAGRSRRLSYGADDGRLRRARPRQDTGRRRRRRAPAPPQVDLSSSKATAARVKTSNHYLTGREAWIGGQVHDDLFYHSEGPTPYHVGPGTYDLPSTFETKTFNVGACFGAAASKHQRGGGGGGASADLSSGDTTRGVEEGAPIVNGDRSEGATRVVRHRMSLAGLSGIEYHAGPGLSGTVFDGTLHDDGMSDASRSPGRGIDDWGGTEGGGGFPTSPIALMATPRGGAPRDDHDVNMFVAAGGEETYRQDRMLTRRQEIEMLARARLSEAAGARRRGRNANNGDGDGVDGLSDGDGDGMLVSRWPAAAPGTVVGPPEWFDMALEAWLGMSGVDLDEDSGGANGAVSNGGTGALAGRGRFEIETVVDPSPSMRVRPCVMSQGRGRAVVDADVHNDDGGSDDASSESESSSVYFSESETESDLSWFDTEERSEGASPRSFLHGGGDGGGGAGGAGGAGSEGNGDGGFDGEEVYGEMNEIAAGGVVDEASAGRQGGAAGANMVDVNGGTDESVSGTRSPSGGVDPPHRRRGGATTSPGGGEDGNTGRSRKLKMKKTKGGGKERVVRHRMSLAGLSKPKGWAGGVSKGGAP